VNELGQETYPIDSSWAIQSANLSNTFGDTQALYDSYIQGCLKVFEEQADHGGWSCNDDPRIKMNKNQPVGMRVRCIHTFPSACPFSTF
jgi:hypothetical protein